MKPFFKEKNQIPYEDFRSIPAFDPAEERFFFFFFFFFLSAAPLPPGPHNLLRQPKTSRQFRRLKGEERNHQSDVISDSNLGYKGYYQTLLW
jgi:hypothetical protein